MFVAIFTLGVILGVFVAGGIWWFIRRVQMRALRKSLSATLMLVKIPKDNSSEGKPDIAKETNRFEQFISNLAALKEEFALEVAVPHIGEEIHFYISVPRKAHQTTLKMIQGVWSGASVEDVRDDYNIFNSHGVTVGATISQKEKFSLPIRTYAELEADSFNAILSGFSKVNQIGEGAAMQLILRPASSGVKKSIKKILEQLHKGTTFEEASRTGASFKDLKAAFNPEAADKEKKEHLVDEDSVKAVGAKLSKPLFEVSMRVLASASSPFQANDLLDGLVGSLQQFAAPRRNEFKITKAKNPNKIAEQFVFRRFGSSGNMILNSEEIASIYHFPTAATDAPKVKWLKSREAPPPPNMPDRGTRIGRSSYRGEERPAFITDDDRRRHVYAIGQTGTGKSTLLTDMIIEDLKNGKGLCLIDPHGDLYQRIISWIPKERLDDLVYFDPSDLWRPVGLNMLDYNFNRPEEKTFIVNEMQSIFDQLFDQASMGPMFQQYMRNALLLLMEDMPNEPATLVEVPRVFTDAEFRKRKLARIHNPVVIDFWEKEATKAGGEASLANMTPYITSKFGNFISNDYLRPIIGQPKSAFNFREIMDSGKIMLVNLSKGKIGEINASLLGMIIIGKITMAALSRGDIQDQSKRRDFNLYIDEFQNFTTNAIASILSEARKYGLTLTMAHQFIGQLKENIRDAVFGNVGSMCVFRVGTEDAEFLAKQFDPVFNSNDLLGVDNLNCFAKILINGQTSIPFNMKLDCSSFTKGPYEALADKYKEYVRLKYGMDREEVERNIHDRLRN